MRVERTGCDVVVLVYHFETVAGALTNSSASHFSVLFLLTLLTSSVIGYKLMYDAKI